MSTGAAEKSLRLHHHFNDVIVLFSYWLVLNLNVYSTCQVTCKVHAVGAT